MSDDFETSREAHRLMLSLGALVLGILGILLAFGTSWTSLLLIVVLVLSLSALQSMGWLSGRSSTETEESIEPGTTECPHCGSVQTDHVTRYDERGREYDQLHCFACDRDLDASAVS